MVSRCREVKKGKGCGHGGSGKLEGIWGSMVFMNRLVIYL